MRSAAEGLEPAERDPKKLARTAWILVGLMVIGGVVIWFSYERMAKNQSQEFRPAFGLGELKGHVRLQLHDGTVTDTSQIEEDVWLFMQTTFAERDEHVEREKALALVPVEGVRRVVFFVDQDPNKEEDRERMATLEAEEGVWKVAARAKVLDKFLKNSVKFGTVPHQKDGKWVYDTSVIILKRDEPEGKNPRTHIRGEIFDFDRAKRDAVENGVEGEPEGYHRWFAKHVDYLLKEGDPTKKSDE